MMGFAISPSEPRAGQPVTVTARILYSAPGAAPPPAGTISLQEGSQAVGTVAVNSSGTASFTITSLTAGTHFFSANYSGDQNYYDLSGSSVSVTVLGRASTATSTPAASPSSLTFGQPVTLSTSVTGQGSGVPTGTVTFSDGGVAWGSAPLDGAGVARITAAPPDVGNHSITASYSGDQNFAPSVSAPLGLSVGKVASLTANPIVSSGTAVFGTALTFSAQVSSSYTQRKPTGSVTFYDGSLQVGIGSLGGDGTASLTTSSLTTGIHRIIASYSGDDVFLPSTSNVLTLTIKGLLTVNLSLSAKTVSVRGALTLSATAALTSASPQPSGVFSFRDGDTEIGNASISATGQATLSLPTVLLRAGAPHKISAAYSGDANYVAVSTPSQSLMVLAGFNGLAFSTGNFAPDEIVTFFGSSFSVSTAAASSLPLPTELAGVTVKLQASNGTIYSAPLFYVSPTQINFVFPAGVSPGPAIFTIVAADGTSYSIPLTMISVAPGLASAAANGQGPAAAQVIRVHPDGTRESAQTVAVLQTGSATWSSVPLSFKGDALYLILYATGIRNRKGDLSCSAAGKSFSSLYAGEQGAYPGLDQINVLLPPTLAGAGLANLICTVDDQTSNPVGLLFP